MYFLPNSCSVLFGNSLKKNCGMQEIGPEECVGRNYYPRLVTQGRAQESEWTVGITRFLIIEWNA